ncbi:MAG: type II secretion system F family protein [bacterium]
MEKIKVRRSYEKEGFKAPVFEYRPDWPYISIGFGDEKDYFIENLSLLIASGMGISNALSSISSSVKSPRMKRITTYIEEAVNAGMPLWKAFEETGFFPNRVIALIRSGEQAGKLPEHLNLVTLQQHKEKIFKSRLRSALIYPSIVILLAFIIALGSTWFVLPNLISIFTQSQTTLPLTTRILLWLGITFKSYGIIIVPGLIGIVSLVLYILFVNKKTKFVGDAILFSVSGIKSLVQGIELARFGYIFGALLQAGFQMDEALEAIKEGTDYDSYRNFYSHIQENVVKGESFSAMFKEFKKSDNFIPPPIQQLIISAEKSGRLPETLIKIGVIFEEKTEAMSQDLSTVLEPIVLIIVGLIVALVVSGIIGPIYGLSSQI